MKKILLSFIGMLFAASVMSQNLAVSTYTPDWWVQSGKNCADGETDGWYYRSNVASERLVFNGTVTTPCHIATMLGMGKPWLDMVIKFRADINTDGTNTTFILGSNAAWGGQGVMIEASKYGVMVQENFDYSVLNWISTDVATYQGKFTGGFYNFIIRISATGLISVQIDDYLLPGTFQVTALGLSDLQNNDFFMVNIGSKPATGWRMKVVDVQRGATKKSYFPTATAPAVSTTSVTINSSTSATAIGNVTSDGGAFTVTRGFCWGAVTGPTIADSKSEESTLSGGIGSYTHELTLSAHSDYYIRPYVTSVYGTEYGTEQMITTKSAQAHLSGLTVDGTAVSGFDSNTLSYNIELPFGSTAIPVVAYTLTDELATAALVNPDALPGSSIVTVTAEDGVTKLEYTIAFTVAAGAGNANLSGISINDVAISGFDPATLSYSAGLANGTTEVPVVTYALADATSSAVLTNATSLPGSTTIVVTAQDGTTVKTYTIEFTLAAAQIADFFPMFGKNAEWAVNEQYELVFSGAVAPGPVAAIATTFGGLVSDGVGGNDFTGLNIKFDGIIMDAATNTVVVLGWDAVWGGKGINLEFNQWLCQATTDFSYGAGADKWMISNPGAYQPIVNKNGYNAFEINVDEAGLISCKLNGFVCDVPYQASLASLKPTAASTFFVAFVNNLTGFKMKNLVVTKGGVTKKYFSAPVAAGTDAHLSDLKIDGLALPGFDQGTFTYNYELPYGTVAIPAITYTLADVNASAVIQNTVSLPGASLITVTAEDGTTKLEYAVSFTLAAPSQNASLSGISSDGVAIEGFSANTFSYPVKLAQGTTTVPVVTYVLADEKANAVITNASALPGNTTIVVTAQDGSTVLTYTIEFTVHTSIQSNAGAGFSLYPNPASSSINIRSTNDLTGKSYSVVSMDGKVCLNGKINQSEQSIDISGIPAGNYFLTIEKIKNKMKFVKK